jgi:hypothetical protein
VSMPSSHSKAWPCAVSAFNKVDSGVMLVNSIKSASERSSPEHKTSVGDGVVPPGPLGEEFSSFGADVGSGDSSIPVGRLVGLGVGGGVGDIVGSTVGGIVGSDMGDIVGSSVGGGVGIGVGSDVGARVGAKVVGAKVGVAVSQNVGMSVSGDTIGVDGAGV